MCERLWRWPEARECLCSAILAPSWGVGYNRRLCRSLCAGAGGMFLQPSSRCLRSCAAVGRQAQSRVCRAAVYPAQPPMSPVCVPLPPVTLRTALSAGSRKLEYNGQTWHEHCFICSSCQQPIGSRSFIPDKKDYYCVPCYESKFAPRCTRCKKVGLAWQPRAPVAAEPGTCSPLLSEPCWRRVQVPAPRLAAVCTLQPFSPCLCITGARSLPADPDQGRSDLPG